MPNYKEYNKTWYQNNKQWHVDYHKQNRDKLTQYSNDYYLQNKEKKREYYLQNKERISLLNKERYLKKKSNIIQNGGKDTVHTGAIQTDSQNETEE